MALLKNTLSIALFLLVPSIVFAEISYPANSESIVQCNSSLMIDQKLKSLERIDYTSIPKSYLVATKAYYQVESDNLNSITVQDFQKRKQGFICAEVKSNINFVSSIYAPVVITVNGSKEPNVTGFKKIWQFSVVSKPSENIIGLWNSASKISQNQRLVGKSFFGRFAEVKFYKSSHSKFIMVVTKSDSVGKSKLMIEFDSFAKLPPSVERKIN